MQSAFEMPADQRATIQNALNETFSAEVRVRFEAAPDRICGIELTADGQKIGWSIAEYLTSLDRKVGALLKRASPLKPGGSQMSILQDAVDRTFGAVGQALEDFKPRLTPHEVGIVTNVAIGIATVSGLPGVEYEELVRFPGGIQGIAFNIDEDEIGVILLGPSKTCTQATKWSAPGG